MSDLIVNGIQVLFGIGLIIILGRALLEFLSMGPEE